MAPTRIRSFAPAAERAKAAVRPVLTKKERRLVMLERTLPVLRAGTIPAHRTASVNRSKLRFEATVWANSRLPRNSPHELDWFPAAAPTGSYSTGEGTWRLMNAYVVLKRFRSYYTKNQ
jgi:hypothetical protein